MYFKTILFRFTIFFFCLASYDFAAAQTTSRPHVTRSAFYGTAELIVPDAKRAKINIHGLVVGQRDNGSVEEAFIWHREHGLFGFPYRQSSGFTTINNNLQISGFYEVLGRKRSFYSSNIFDRNKFVWSSRQDLRFVDSNNLNYLIGVDSYFTPVIAYQSGEVSLDNIINVPSGFTLSEPLAISDDFYLVGFHDELTRFGAGYIADLSTGTFYPLGMPAGVGNAGVGVAYDVANGGIAVGELLYRSQQPALWRASILVSGAASVTTLPVPRGGYSGSAIRINEQGLVLGAVRPATFSGASKAVVWAPESTGYSLHILEDIPGVQALKGCEINSQASYYLKEVWDLADEDPSSFETRLLVSCENRYPRPGSRLYLVTLNRS